MTKKQNLFILHTQYNLILGLAFLNRFCRNDSNDLIVYSEFQVSSEMEEKLRRIFSRVIFLRKQFEPLKSGLIAEKEMLHYVKESKKFIHSYYDSIVISQDRGMEQILIKELKHKNPNCTIICVEEDSYYTINSKEAKANYFKNLIKKVYRFVATSNWMNISVPSCYGSTPFVEMLYVNYPDCIRKELDSKEKIAVQSEDLRWGIQALLGNSKEIALKEKSIVIISDLIERYADPSKVLNSLKTIVEIAEDLGVRVFIKYHPREKQKLKMNNVLELESSIAMESYLLMFDPSITCIVGNASAALFVSKTLNYKAISLINICDNRKDISIAISKMGIAVPTEKELSYQIKQFCEE